MPTLQRTFLAAIFSMLFLTAGAWAAPCPEASRQFDFWIGDWEVTTGGQPAGTNRIVPILEGCVLQENWQGAGGSAGTSLNYYNPQTGKWHQFWVWREGTTLQLEGGIRDGKMILEGEGRSRAGGALKHRIAWQANADGTVRQLWESSADQGKTWTTSFDGLYRKKKA